MGGVAALCQEKRGIKKNKKYEKKSLQFSEVVIYCFPL